MHRIGQRPPAQTEPTTTLDSTPESTPVTRNEVCIKRGMLPGVTCQEQGLPSNVREC
jgi:hypothetical protein